MRIIAIVLMFLNMKTAVLYTEVYYYVSAIFIILMLVGIDPIHWYKIPPSRERSNESTLVLRVFNDSKS